GIPATLSSLWHELRGAVEQQLAGTQAKPCTNGNRNGNGRHLADGNQNSSPRLSNTANSPTQGEPATKKQVSYLISCAKRFRNLNMDQTREWLVSAHKTTLETLTKTQAGQIIDELTGKAGAR
ncbi:MAG: hypothetical protein L6Q71_12155, partial [Planctomycetes bacterium]|nr:hypothetical protein [Planctomycetota bacterium]